MNGILTPTAQLRLAWWVFWGSILGWPATAFTIFREEPQGILGLSWFAIILGAYNTIVTTQVNKEVQDAAPLASADDVKEN